MSAVRYTDWHASPVTTANMMRGIVNAVEQGLADEGMPLTDGQLTFLARAVEQSAS